MKGSCVVFLFLVMASAVYADGDPPHCTKLSKTTDYAANHRIEYPSTQIAAGRKELFQTLHCPSDSVSESKTEVCDWAAPPVVQFTIDDKYVFVKRVDPLNRFDRPAVIKTSQRCSRETLPEQTKIVNTYIVTEMYKTV